MMSTTLLLIPSKKGSGYFRSPIFFYGLHAIEKSRSFSASGPYLIQYPFFVASALSSEVFFLIILFHRESARQLLDHEEIIVDAEEHECHEREDDDLIDPIRPLDQDEDHHDDRSDPYETPCFFPGPSETEQSMVQMGIIAFERALPHHEHSPQSDPYRIEDHERKRDDQSSDLGASDDREIGEAKSEEHDAHISHQSKWFEFDHGGDE